MRNFFVPKWCLLPAFVLALAAFPAAAESKRTLLFEGAVYPWKIAYVRERRPWVREEHYYAVEHDGRPLVLPRALFGAVRDVDRFLAASGFDSGATNADSVLLVFEVARSKPDGFERRELVAALARSQGAAGSAIGLYTLQGEPIGEIEPEAAP